MSRPFALFAVFLLLVPMLIGCGGNRGSASPSSGTLRPTPINARISLPSGMTVDVRSLRVWTSGGATNPDASGNVRVVVYNNGPQYTEARDASGNLIASGFLGKGRAVLDAASTAEALGFFATGAFVLPSNARMVVLNDLRAVNGFTSVSEEVTGALQRTGKVDPTEPSLNGALTTLVANAGGNRAKAVLQRTASGSRGTVVNPTTSASGISLDTIIDGELKISNVHFRRAIGWLEPTSYELADGSTQIASGQQMQTPFEIASPKRYAGLIGTLADIYNRDTWSAVTLDPKPVPAVYPGIANCVATTYKLTVAGVGLNRGDFNQLSDVRASTARKFMVKAFMLDYVVPLVASVLVPANGDAIDDFVKFSGGNAVVTDLINTLFVTSPNLWQLCSEGKYGEAFKTIYESGVLAGSVLPKMTQAFLDWAATSSIESVAQNTARYAEDAKYILGTLGAVDLAISQGEQFLIATDLAISDQANVFTITSTGGKVSISVAEPVISYDHSTSIQAVIQNKNPEAVYRYDWTVKTGFELTDSLGRSSQNGTLTSSQDTVTIRSNGEQGPADVTCKVTRIDGDEDRPIDTGRGSVLFLGRVSLTPSSSNIKINETGQFAASYDGAGDVEWKYTLSNTSVGNVSPSGRSASKTVYLYASSTSGQTILTAEGFLKVGSSTFSLGKATATVSVGNQVVTLPTTLHVFGAVTESVFNDGTKGYVPRTFVVIEVPSVEPPSPTEGHWRYDFEATRPVSSEINSGLSGKRFTEIWYTKQNSHILPGANNPDYVRSQQPANTAFINVEGQRVFPAQSSASAGQSRLASEIARIRAAYSGMQMSARAIPWN